MKKVLVFLESLVVIALVIAGLAGILYNALRDDGWIAHALAGFWEFQFRYPMLAIPATIIGIIVYIWWRDRRVALGKISRIPTIALYMLMAAGAYYIAEYAIRGTL